MNMHWFLTALLATALVTPAWAQTVGQPLNLKLPPSELPPASATVAAPAQSRAANSVPVSNAPGVYYGDTSGRTYADSDADSPSDCDDYSYNKPQIHGSVGAGVVGGSHFSGNYQGGEANLTKRFGSCDDPQGGISISVGGSTGRFHDH